MAFISVVPVAEAEGDVRAMYEREQADWGYVPNYAKVFSARPEIIGLWGSLLAAIRQRIEPRRYELATVTAAHARRNSYCALAHGERLSRMMSADGVRALFADADGAGVPAADAALTAFARKVAVDAAAVTAEDVAALRRVGFSDPEIFDVAAAVAARAFLTTMLDALGAEPDAAFARLESPLRDALAVGRPIDPAPPERLDSR